MKKTITLLLACMGLSFSAFAQSIVPTPNDSASVAANVADEFDPVDVHIHVINNYGQATSFMWAMKNYAAPSQWELKLCDNNNCYDLLFGSQWHESLTVNAGDSMDMKFQYSPHCVNGAGSTNIMVYVTGDSAATALMLNYKADLTTSCPNAITEVSSNTLQVFPNPVRNIFTVSGLKNAGSFSFEVCDLKGALVKSEIKGTTNTSVEISIENLPAGTYVLKATDEKGRVAGTARLSKVE